MAHGAAQVGGHGGMWEKRSQSYFAGPTRE